MPAASLVFLAEVTADEIAAWCALAAARGVVARIVEEPGSGDRVLELEGDAADEVAQEVARSAPVWTLEALAPRLEFGNPPAHLILAAGRVGLTSVARGEETHVALFQRVLFHPAREVRLAAVTVRAPGRLASNALRCLLPEAADEDPDDEVRVAARARLDALGPEVGLPAPTPYDGDDDDLPF